MVKSFIALLLLISPVYAGSGPTERVVRAYGSDGTIVIKPQNQEGWFDADVYMPYGSSKFVINCPRGFVQAITDSARPGLMYERTADGRWRHYSTSDLVVERSHPPGIYRAVCY